MTRKKQIALHVVLPVLIACAFLITTCSTAIADGGNMFVSFDWNDRTESIVSVENTLSDGSTMPAYFPNTPVAMDEGTMSPNSIIGDDDRQRLSSTEVHTYPYSAIVLLYFGWDTDDDDVVDSYYIGTGTMVGPVTILTAAHCLWNSDYGWPDDYRVYPFVSSSSLSGSTYYSASTFYIPSAYQSGINTQNNDWGIINLPSDCNLCDDTGYMGYSTSESLLGKEFVISGYPGDDCYYQNMASGTVIYETSTNCFYDIDTYGGESGAAVFSESTGTLWAVHAYGGTTSNNGCKIIESIYDAISMFRDEYQDATTFMYRLYKRGLDRDPDVVGLNSWVGLLKDGLTGGKTAARGIFFSTEFTSQNYNNTDYVTRLYQAMLNRAPDTSGLNSWVSLLESGTSRLTVFNGIANSQEFINICTSCGISH